MTKKQMTPEQQAQDDAIRAYLLGIDGSTIQAAQQPTPTTWRKQPWKGKSNGQG